MNTPYLFIGPTLTACQQQVCLNDYQVKPPAHRGSIEAIITQVATPGVIIIVDGALGDTLAVSHQELMRAAQAGWQLWGLADMGAIRAVEMNHPSIHGFGQVYQQLSDNPDLRDDEILWSYTNDESYQVQNEPMIHLNHALSHLHQLHHIDTAAHNEVVQQLQQTWYKHRTVQMMLDLLHQHSPTLTPEPLSLVSNDFNLFCLKQQDFVHFIEQKPWQ
jgi:hypothetical protein